MAEITKANVNLPQAPHPKAKKDNNNLTTRINIGACAGLLVGGVIGGFVKKNAELKDGDVVQFMKNKDEVKYGLTPEGQARSAIISEKKQKLKHLDSIADKLLEKKALETEDIKKLKEQNILLISNKAPQKLKEYVEKANDELDLLSKPNPDIRPLAEKFHETMIKSTTDFKAFASDLFDLNYKATKENLTGDALKTETENLLNKHPIHEQTSKELDFFTDLVGKSEKDIAEVFSPAETSKESLLTAYDTEIKSITDNKEKHIKDFTEGAQDVINMFKEKVAEKAKEFKPLEDKAILDNPKFKAVKEEAEKALKSTKFRIGIGIGAAIGTVVGAVVAFALPKKKSEKPQ